MVTQQYGRGFVPFHQEDESLTRKFGGTGLGLALADRIVRRMEGNLELCGEPGVGTRVQVRVKLEEEKWGSESRSAIGSDSAPETQGIKQGDAAGKKEANHRETLPRPGVEGVDAQSVEKP